MYFHTPHLHSVHFLSESPHLLASHFSNTLSLPITDSLNQSCNNKYLNCRLLKVLGSGDDTSSKNMRIVISKRMKTTEEIAQKRLSRGGEESSKSTSTSPPPPPPVAPHQSETTTASSLFEAQIMDDFNHMMDLHDTHIRSITFRLKSLEAMQTLYERSLKHGAIGLGITQHNALIKVPYSDILHYFVVRDNDIEENLSTFRAPSSAGDSSQNRHLHSNQSCNLNYIDHLAIAVEKDTAEKVSQWYIDALDFERFYVNDEDQRDHGLIIQGLRTLVVCPRLETESDMQQSFKIVFVEPVKQVNGKKSQIQEFLDYHGGPGVAHLAFNTSDICSDVAQASKCGMEFVTVPHTYYKLWEQKKGYDIVAEKDSWERIRELSIMVDGNANGGVCEKDESTNSSSYNYLLQTFSHPLGSRPTFYIELICRRGSTGFGKGNIKQLFDAVEMLQKQRGNEWE